MALHGSDSHGAWFLDELGAFMLATDMVLYAMCETLPRC